jgi:hypothetical protein
MKLRAPTNLKFWGTNLCCDVTTLGVGLGGWPAMWSAWNWDGWIKPQIDLMVGNGVGCNAVRVQGAAYAVQNGTIPMGTYLARWTQLIEYCRERGVYVYPCGCTVDNDTSFALPVATMGAVFAEIFRHHQAFDNVIGIDIIQEMSLEDVPTQDIRRPYLQALLLDIKSRGVTLPLTYSTGELIDLGYPWGLSIAPFVDFIDVHSYYRTAVVGQLDAYLTGYPYKDIIMGEAGAEIAWSTADAQFSTLRSCVNLMNGGHPNLRGMLIWSSTDPSVAAGKGWGQYAYDNTGPRLDRLNLLRRMTGGSVASANVIR